MKIRHRKGCPATYGGACFCTDNTTMPLNIAFIRERRLQLGLTQQQAADAAGFPNLQKWSQYENGRVADPQLSTLEAIARALRCGVVKLIK